MEGGRVFGGVCLGVGGGVVDVTVRRWRAAPPLGIPRAAAVVARRRSRSSRSACGGTGTPRRCNSAITFARVSAGLFVRVVRPRRRFAPPGSAGVSIKQAG